jgi:pyridoxamine 5'-phosphate oxidase
MMPVTVSDPDLRAMRRDYETVPFGEADLAPTWLEQFRRWLADAVAGGEAEPNALVVATAGAGGRTGARTVLLKEVDERGFVFNTNYASRKGREVEENPRATLVFPWLDVRRQVVVDGAVERVSPDEADAYFATRPREARISAHASPQSEVVESREALEALREKAAARFGEDADVPRPEGWGGLRVVPEAVEFWQGRANRLHDRLRYRREADGTWVIERLAP